MKLVIVSTFWNAERFVPKCIESLKNQYYTNFVAYFIDDMSTDNSFDVAKKTIGDDERFILIKNEEKKYKTKNFIDVIRDNDNIAWDDVIIEIDGDDRLADNFVLGRINKVFSDENIWLCGTRWKDVNNRLGNYSKPIPEKARLSTWNFSHMRSYRTFLFRLIKDDHLKYNGEYFKAACDLGFGIPLLEMSGSEHFFYINEPLYVYSWHDHQSYSSNNSFNDGKLQSKIASYIYRLPKYDKIELSVVNSNSSSNTILFNQIQKDNRELLNQILSQGQRVEQTIDYNKINEVLSKESKPKEPITPPKPNLPKDRKEIIQLKKDSIIATNRKLIPSKPNRRNDSPNIFGKR